MKSNNIKSLENIKKIHFIGIGGSGMFPLASILHSKGFIITGSDIYPSDTLEKVKALGIDVKSKQSEENITDQDLVVFSAAIKETNPEIVAAKSKNIPIIERSVMLGIIFNKYNNSIGVSGTHGKTTTTSMIASTLLDLGKDPTAVIGGTLPKIKSNSCCGKSDIIVAEACEYVDSFLQLYPAISIITNVEADHLDYFGSLENVKNSFKKFALQTKRLIIANGDDKNIRDILKDVPTKTLFFGTSHDNDFYADNIVFNKLQCAEFDVFKDTEKISHISLSVPGKHNMFNALACLITCMELGAEIKNIEKSLNNFKGVHRRFENLGTIGGITVVDDFAHHPTEINTTLNAATKMGFKKVWAIFQPHTYSRTSMFLNEFADALSQPEKVIISEILPVRETNTYGIHSEDLVKKMSNAVYIPTFEEITDYVVKNAEDGDLVITLGGGNVYKCANMIVEKLKEKN